MKVKKSKQLAKITNEVVSLDELKPHPKNYRKHGADQLSHIMASIKEHGFYKNIVVANDGTILAGHGAVAAAKELGIKEIPIARLDIGPNDKRAMKILTGDNEISKLSEVDDRLLSEILKDIAEFSLDDLLGTGFDGKQLANLVYVSRPANEVADFDAAAEWVGLPAYEERDDAKAKLPIIEITFQNKEDRDKYVEETKLRIGTKIGERKWATTWPFLGRNDTKNIRFKKGEKK